MWTDTREVSICSCVQWGHSAPLAEGRGWAISEGPCPQINSCDRVQQAHGSSSINSVHRKTRKWYITVFQHFLHIAVTNSYIHKELCGSQQKHKTRQQFQEELSAQVLGVPLDGRLDNSWAHPCSYKSRAVEITESQHGAVAVHSVSLAVSGVRRGPVSGNSTKAKKNAWTHFQKSRPKGKN